MDRRGSLRAGFAHSRACGWIVLLIVCTGCGQGAPSASADRRATTSAGAASADEANPDALQITTETGRLTNWYTPVPDEIRDGSVKTGTDSNILPKDYAGAETCKKCHEQNYEDWSRHPHGRMNALANESTVLGDFSGNASIEFLGGTVSFYQEQDQYRMKLVRGDIRRVYDVTQTIGSRFQQAYVGKVIDGPERTRNELYTVDHVLPFMYWLDREEWHPFELGRKYVPTEERIDPYTATTVGAEGYQPYANRCSVCHTTYAMGDALIRKRKLLGRVAPVSMDFSATDYMKEVHPELISRGLRKYPNASIAGRASLMEMYHMEGPEHAVNLGISCEACHLGARHHAEHESDFPTFLPRSPHLYTRSESANLDFGRTHTNRNWACSQCHTGTRTYYAADMSKVNSSEFDDAMKGSCYSKLDCVDCHNPHQATGTQWSAAPALDDAKCITCHEKFSSPDSVAAHTHHPAGSSGSRCMDCHMPRIVEGIQDIVRTHMIFSPTHPGMIAENHPNACNQCHVEKPIDWTITHLREWYGTEVSATSISSSYGEPAQPVAVGWLKHDDPAVRLVGADALLRNRATWALDELIGALDDPLMTNRKYAMSGLEDWFDVRLKDFGYRFYQVTDERKLPLERIRKELSPSDEPARPSTKTAAAPDSNGRLDD